MKRAMMVLISIIGCIFILGIATANAQDITWHQPAQVTIGWDAVTTYVNGEEIPADVTVLYNMYIKTYPDGEPSLSAANTAINGLQHPLSFTEAGDYVVGITAVTYNEQTEFMAESAVCWSDGSTPDCLGVNGAFGVRFVEVFSTPTGLRIVVAQ